MPRPCCTCERCSRRLLATLACPRLQLRALSAFLGGEIEDSNWSGTQEVIRDFGAAAQAFGGSAPPFLPMTFEEACEDAKGRCTQSQPTYLLVYLHSAAHPDTAHVRDVMCSPDFRALCGCDAERAGDRRCLLWGSDVSHRDGFTVASEVLRATRYPYIAVLFVEDAQARAIAIMEGAVELQNCAQRIREVTAAHAERRAFRAEEVQRTAPLPEAFRAEEVQLTAALRDAARRRDDAIAVASRRRRALVEAQDREAEESARRDRERAELRRAEEAARLEAEDEEREATELRAALALSEDLVKGARVEAARERLGAEPAAGEGVTSLRFRMPGGGMPLRRRFRLDGSVQQLFDYVRVAAAERAGERARNLPSSAGGCVSNFAIECSYPQRKYFESPVQPSSLPQRSLRELGLADTALFVRDLDA